MSGQEPREILGAVGEVMDIDFPLEDADWEMMVQGPADDQYNTLLAQEVLQQLGLFGTPADTAPGGGAAPAVVVSRAECGGGGAEPAPHSSGGGGAEPAPHSSGGGGGGSAPPGGIPEGGGCFLDIPRLLQQPAGGLGSGSGSAAQQVAELLSGTHPSMRGTSLEGWLQAEGPVVTMNNSGITEGSREGGSASGSGLMPAGMLAQPAPALGGGVGCFSAFVPVQQQQPAAAAAHPHPSLAVPTPNLSDAGGSLGLGASSAGVGASLAPPGPATSSPRDSSLPQALQHQLELQQQLVQLLSAQPPQPPHAPAVQPQLVALPSGEYAALLPQAALFPTGGAPGGGPTSSAGGWQQQQQQQPGAAFPQAPPRQQLSASLREQLSQQRSQDMLPVAPAAAGPSLSVGTGVADSGGVAGAFSSASLAGLGPAELDAIPMLALLSNLSGLSQLGELSPQELSGLGAQLTAGAGGLSGLGGSDLGAQLSGLGAQLSDLGAVLNAAGSGGMLGPAPDLGAQLSGGMLGGQLSGGMEGASMAMQAGGQASSLPPAASVSPTQPLQQQQTAAPAPSAATMSTAGPAPSITLGFPPSMGVAEEEEEEGLVSSGSGGAMGGGGAASDSLRPPPTLKRFSDRQQARISKIQSELAKLQHDMKQMRLENARLRSRNTEVEHQLKAQQAVQQLAAAAAASGLAAAHQQQQEQAAGSASGSGSGSGLELGEQQADRQPLSFADSASPPNSRKKLLMQLSDSMRPQDREMLAVAALTWPKLRDWYCKLVVRFRDVLQVAPSLSREDAEKSAKEALRSGRYWDLLVLICRPDLSTRVLLESMAAPSPALGTASTPAGPPQPPSVGPGAAGAAAAAAAAASQQWAPAAVEAMQLSAEQREALGSAWRQHRAAAEQRAARRQELLSAIRNGFLVHLQHASPEDIELGKPLARQGLSAMESLRLVVRQEHVSAVAIACTLRKVLSPLQQARLAVAAWPWYPDPAKWAPLLTEDMDSS